MKTLRYADILSDYLEQGERDMVAFFCGRWFRPGRVESIGLMVRFEREEIDRYRLRGVLRKALREVSNDK